MAAVHVEREEFEAIKSMSSSTIRYEQLNDAIKRIKKCKKRLQLRFPAVFRDGVLLQFLCKFIQQNRAISHFACGLSENYGAGFYALNEILKIATIHKYNFRLTDLSFASKEFFDSLRDAVIHEFYIKFDSCSEGNLKLLCEALSGNQYLTKLTFSCKSFPTDQSVQYFAELLSHQNLNIHKLSLSIESITAAQFAIICKHGFEPQSRRGNDACFACLDLEDCMIGYDGMKVLTDTLTQCANIKTLTIGNNGPFAMKAFFESFGKMKYIEKLICNESQLIRAEKLDLELISTAMNEIFDNAQYNKLSVLQIPLFVFHDTSHEALRSFVSALTNRNNRLRVLQIFPLFEHLDHAAMLQRDPAYCQKISLFFDLFFQAASHCQYLQKLYIEMIGSENFFFDEKVADSFSHFLINSKCINELYLPFCLLVDLKQDILNLFCQCKQLISIKDDTLDYQWLEQCQRERERLENQNNNQDGNGTNNSNASLSLYASYFIDDNKRQQLMKAKRYHQIAQKQCQINIREQLLRHMPVEDVANLISTFCGFDANPEYWLSEHA
eukprot:CAMPEP_0197031722 /NCGR_PEP_ID=MMETSP1384-20130603/10634_1 /TAXON_ID=29189 /ORGANISM="Ammonia sp." /LENGTH=553 /DNA_ID=CAMNT_0042461291 /DNA_START=36 /DNA_END=1697 /DNA_ORIENTATION=-